MGQLLRPQLVNGRWRKPVIQGRQKAQLKSYFEKAGVPWIYDKERETVHATSAYNRKPKGTVFKNNYETRLALIRKNLSSMDERILKYRTDRLMNKEPTYDEQHMMAVYKALSSEQTASKFKSTTAGKAKAAAKAADAAIGIEARKSSPVKKQAGSSRGGGLSKKERETATMGSDLVATKKRGGV